MAAYRRVYDSRHLQADCQEPGSAPEPGNRVWATFTFYTVEVDGRTVAECPHRGAARTDGRTRRIHNVSGRPQDGHIELLGIFIYLS